MRDDILAAVSEVPGVIEALSVRFSQIDIGYGDSNEPFAPGTRVNPDTIGADDLAWSLLTPDAAPRGSATWVQCDRLQGCFTTRRGATRRHRGQRRASPRTVRIQLACVAAASVTPPRPNTRAD